MVLELNDTIVALSSARGPGARAVVRLSGPHAGTIVRQIFRDSAAPDERQRRIYRGAVQLPELPPIPADLHWWPAPRTYTGQPVAELHLISSAPLIERIIDALLHAGARAAQPGEFTLRAFLAGKRDLTRAEAVQAVVAAGTRDELTQALAQLAGGVTQPLHSLRDDLLNLLADVEAGLDFSEEDITFAGRDETLHRLTKGLAHLTQLQRQLEGRATDNRIFRAVLVGTPNAGKSSLFNALAATTALVSPTPGTTRDYLATCIEVDGIAIELVDTAGWQCVETPIERQAQTLGRREVQTADLVLWCVVAGTEPGVLEHGCAAGAEKLIVATKCDLGSPAAGQVPTSAVMGTGLAELKRLLATKARSARQPALAPSLSRCRHHVEACLEHLRRAHHVTLFEEPPELLALELRGALEQIGALVGAVYTDDLLDRIFSRFCIGK